MKRVFVRLLRVLLLAAFLAGCDSHPSDRSVAQQIADGRAPEILNLEADDQFTEAISVARASVGQFVEEITTNYDPDATYAFRVLLGEDGVDAHVWVEVDPAFQQTPEQLVGKVVQVPPEWKRIPMGQGITQEPTLVYDWRVVSDGHVKGAYTTRAIRALMTAEQRKDFDKRTGFKFD